MRRIIVQSLWACVDGGRETVMRTFFNLPFSTVSSFPAFCACLFSCLAVNFRLNSDFSRPDISFAVRVSRRLSAVFLIDENIGKREEFKVSHGSSDSMVEMDLFAALYHQRQQKLSCDVLPADLGLVGNSSAVAVVAVPFKPFLSVGPHPSLLFLKPTTWPNHILKI